MSRQNPQIPERKPLPPHKIAAATGRPVPRDNPLRTPSGSHSENEGTSPEGDRWSDRPAPELLWLEHFWPQAGLWGDQHWAALLRMTVRRFHRLVVLQEIPHIRVGHVIFVEAEAMQTAFAPLPAQQSTRKGVR